MLTLLFLLAGIWILFHKGDRIFHISKEIDPRFKEIIIALGDSSLKNGDVPVTAILIYNENIIGKGYNTVFRDDDPTGHAEINCIREAMQKIGYIEFMKLNRDSLALLVSFEPCIMCRGTLLNYNINNTYYLKAKSLSYLLMEDLKQICNQLKRKKLKPDSIQQNLFLRHPKYPRPGD